MIILKSKKIVFASKLKYKIALFPSCFCVFQLWSTQVMSLFSLITIDYLQRSLEAFKDQQKNVEMQICCSNCKCTQVGKLLLNLVLSQSHSNLALSNKVFVMNVLIVFLANLSLQSKKFLPCMKFMQTLFLRS